MAVAAATAMLENFIAVAAAASLLYSTIDLINRTVAHKSE